MGTNKDQVDNDKVLSNVLKHCRENSIVAFKEKERDMWFTGSILSIYSPNNKYNKSDKWSVTIDLNIPIQPQWYDEGDKTIYYYDDICELIIIEK